MSTRPEVFDLIKNDKPETIAALCAALFPMYALDVLRYYKRIRTVSDNMYDSIIQIIQEKYPETWDALGDEI